MRSKEVGKKYDRDKNIFTKQTRERLPKPLTRYFQDQVFYFTCIIFSFAPLQTCSAPSKLFVLKIKHAKFCNGMHFTVTSELLLHPA